jgi:hypothetical protein
MAHSRYRQHAIRLASLVALITSVLAFHAKPASAAGSITLAWTSPADRPGTGRVTAYDLRISTQAISNRDTLGWWNKATKISMNAKTPAAPGQPEAVLLGGLVLGVRYYAILRSVDGRLNWSPFSNMASFTPSLVTAAPEGEAAPAFVLGLPRPTPSSGRTDVNLELPKPMTVEAGVFNAQGRLVRTLESGTLPAGVHILHWDGRLNAGGDAPSGVYWIRVGAGAINKRVKLIVAR